MRFPTPLAASLLALLSASLSTAASPANHHPFSPPHAHAHPPAPPLYPAPPPYPAPPAPPPPHNRYSASNFAQPPPHLAAPSSGPLTRSTSVNSFHSPPPMARLHTTPASSTQTSPYHRAAREHSDLAAAEAARRGANPLPPGLVNERTARTAQSHTAAATPRIQQAGSGAQRLGTPRWGGARSSASDSSSSPDHIRGQSPSPARPGSTTATAGSSSRSSGVASPARGLRPGPGPGSGLPHGTGSNIGLTLRGRPSTRGPPARPQHLGQRTSAAAYRLGYESGSGSGTTGRSASHSPPTPMSRPGAVPVLPARRAPAPGPIGGLRYESRSAAGSGSGSVFGSGFGSETTGRSASPQHSGRTQRLTSSSPDRPGTPPNLATRGRPGVPAPGNAPPGRWRYESHSVSGSETTGRSGSGSVSVSQSPQPHGTAVAAAPARERGGAVDSRAPRTEAIDRSVSRTQGQVGVAPRTEMMSRWAPGTPEAQGAGSVTPRATAHAGSGSGATPRAMAYAGLGAGAGTTPRSGSGGTTPRSYSDWTPQGSPRRISSGSSTEGDAMGRIGFDRVA